MLAKRLSQKIKAQDWFGTLIDLVIVVLGIFLALQVNQWQESQRAKAIETQILSRLSEDLNQLAMQNQNVVASLNKKLQDIDLAIAFVRNTESWQKSFQSWQKTLRPTLGYRDPVLELAVYEEILATAQFSFIRSEQTRSELSKISHQLELTRNINESFNLVYAPAYQTVFEHLVEREEAPERFETLNKDQQLALLKSLHSMKRTVFVVKEYALRIAKNAADIKSSLKQK